MNNMCTYSGFCASIEHSLQSLVLDFMLGLTQSENGVTFSAVWEPLTKEDSTFGFAVGPCLRKLAHE